MSKFITTLKTEQLERRSFRLLSSLHYQDKIGDIVVPSGFITDFASIKAIHNIVVFPLYAIVSGYGNYASTVHDYLYSKRMFSRKQCDEIFYRALRSEGVAKWRAWLMYAGVRIGGRKAYED